MKPESLPELIESLKGWKRMTRSEILLIMAKIQDYVRLSESLTTTAIPHKINTHGIHSD